MKVIFTTVVALCFSLLAIQKIAAQTKPAAKKAAAKAPASMAASMANGQRVYLQYCLSCHQMDGGGVPNMNPPLVKTTYVLGDKVRLIKIVLNGFAQNVDIDGQSYSNTMPPQNMLKDQEIADVLTYVRNSFTNKASAVKVAEVKAVRGTVKK
ncbi:c-type cytochrome [Mucilaginibacter paludis]|uniref:Cytochrome c class I n=1 Tax=Mucilaginibacter paludis DSM 18603 TaxID=714943 RepID=H1YAL7_9SPHI|nr:cytochrome c [Mucilaginibacter paludis]EHQ29137.1 cytochrome c class I [Mucilaginibacter paludis DSM 18603]